MKVRSPPNYFLSSKLDLEFPRCMYRGRPSWRCPWDRAFQLGQGEGPIGLVGPISNPAVPTAPRHSRWNVLVHLHALSGPTLLWAAKGVLCPHVGGTVTHRAHKEEGVEFVTKVNDIFDALWLGTISMTLYSISLLEYFL